jgi:DNA-binding NarL/FixJ family response regulator
MEPDEKLFLTAIRSGAMGYLLKDASASDLVCAVRAVYQGDAVCPPQLCSALFRFVARSTEEIPSKRWVRRPDLTLRQQQLMALVAKGLTNKEIALSLHLSEFTVRNHIHRILKQLDAGSRTAAVEAIRCQVVPGQRSMGKRFRAARAKFILAWGRTYWPQVRGTSSRSTDLLS